MGLDQFAYKVQRVKGLKNFSFPKSALADKEFGYWRKFYGLQAWMKRLYCEKGGKGVFNCVPLKLTAQDLERLERDCGEDDFYQDRYFETVEEEKEHQFDYLQNFIKKAKGAIAKGYAVYYSSWW